MPNIPKSIYKNFLGISTSLDSNKAIPKNFFTNLNLLPSLKSLNFNFELKFNKDGDK